MRKWLILALAVVGNVAIAAETKSAKKSVSGLCKGCNVLLIGMDAMQGKKVSHLGYQRETTPTIDGLAKNGISFGQAISPASWTVPTYLSVFSSTYPSTHGMTNRFEVFNETDKKLSNFPRSKPELQVISEILSKQGYKTGGFTGDAGISAILGYNKGFDIYTDEVQFGGLGTSSVHAEKWLDEVGDKKFFMFLHGYDSHGQYPLAADFRSKFEKPNEKVKFKGTREEQAELREAGIKGAFPELTRDDLEFWNDWYDGKIYDADARLGAFLKKMEEKGLLKNTLIVLFSDHGTEVGEHGRFDHGHSLYDELIHVPLVISAPNLKGGKVIREQVSTLDILPTILEMIGAPVDAKLKKQMVGRSLVPALTGGKLTPRVAYSETDCGNITHKRSIRTADGWKYIMTLEDGKEELYNVQKDPKEKENLISKETKRVASLKTSLIKHMDATSGTTRNISSDCVPVYKGQCEKKDIKNQVKN